MFSSLSGPFGPTLGAANTAGGSPPVITSPSSLVAGTANTLYPTTTFTATGTAPITWSITSGALPTGMSFSSGGVLSGTPTTTFSGSITFTATNAFGFDPRTLTLTVNPAVVGAPVITTYVLFYGVAGSAYSDTLAATGSGITWSIVNGSIAPLILNASTGQITGTPSAAGSLTATFRATNANGTADRQFTIQVIAAGTGAAPTVQGFVSTLTAYAGYPTAYTLGAYSNAAGPHVYEWSVNSGSLPAWLNFNQRGGDGEYPVAGPDKAGSSGGQLWGVAPANTTSSTALTFNLTNTVSPNATTPTLTLNVVAPPNTAPTILTRNVPAARVGVAYSNQLYAFGVPASFTWTLTSGNKPAWLNISSSGLMTGTPSAGDVTSGLIFTFTCTNGIGTATSQNIGFEVKAAGSKALISPSDFTYLGYYDTAFDGLGAPYVQGLAVRRVGSEVRLLSKTYDSNRIIEYSLSGKTPATSGSPSTCQITTTTREWSNSSGFPIGAEVPYLLWDSAGSKLLCNWAINYPNDVEEVNTRIYTATLTDGSPGTLTDVKRLMLDGVPDRRAGTGSMAVPASFQSAYGVGPFAVGLGGSFSRTDMRGSAAIGLSMYGIPDPSGYANNTTLTTAQYKVYATRTSATATRGRKLENITNFLADGEWIQSIQGPDTLNMWSYADRYVGGAWISGATKEGVVAVGYFMAGRVWYEVSAPRFGGAVAEAHIYDPADLGRISQGTQGQLIDPIAANSKTLEETRVNQVPQNNFYRSLQGQPLAFAAYDDVGKVLYVQINGAGPTAYWNRIYAYSVNV